MLLSKTPLFYCVFCPPQISFHDVAGAVSQTTSVAGNTTTLVDGFTNTTAPIQGTENHAKDGEISETTPNIPIQSRKLQKRRRVFDEVNVK